MPGVQGSKTKLDNNLILIIVRGNLNNCRATILAAAYFQNTLKPQD